MVISITACQGRVSVEYGERDTGADVAWSVVNGQLRGCQLKGDWWIRAMPMFGCHAGQSFEGYIDPTSGRFSFACSRGERHIVIVGRGKEPIKAVAVDVVAGGDNDMGVVDITGLCPEN